MNPSSLAILAGIVVDAGLLAIVVVRGRRRWVQATYATCALSFLTMAAATVGIADGVLPARDDLVVLGTLLLSHALTVVLVLSLIHGETLPRRRTAAFLLLAPVPVLAYLAPSQGWTAAAAYEDNVLGGFLVLCLGIALAETLYARLTSRLFAAPSFWLALGITALIVAGPIYTYELEFLRQPAVPGANLAPPIALAAFALVALQGDPFPASARIRRAPSDPGTIRADDALVFDELRPKYAVRLAHEEAARGRATLLLGRTPPPMTASGVTFAGIAPSRHAALRALTTASEFFGTAPGGVVILEGTADLSVLSGWRLVLEMIIRMRHAARDTASTLVLSTSRLTKSERDSLVEQHFAWWDLPDPSTEIESILAQAFGSGASRLFESFCRAHGLRRTDVTTDHVPAILTFLQQALAELSGVVAGTASHGLRVQFEAVAALLRGFAARGPEDLARGKWPSRASGKTDEEMLVTAADYWKGKEMDELFAAAETIEHREPLFEKALAVFVDQLGDEGESVLRSQLARLGKRPEDLDRSDIVRIADRASVDLGNLADVVDLPQEKDRIQRQIRSIRQRLEMIVGGDE